MARKKSAKKPTGAGTSYELSGNVDHGSVAVLGPNAKVAVTQQTGAQIAELTAMFDAVFKKIETLPADPNVDKEEIVETVQKIQTEALQRRPGEHKQTGTLDDQYCADGAGHSGSDGCFPGRSGLGIYGSL